MSIDDTLHNRNTLGNKTNTKTNPIIKIIIKKINIYIYKLKINK